MPRQLAARKPKELDPDDPFQGMTSKQYAFTMASFSGMSDADAYRTVYDVGDMDNVTLWHNAAALAHHPLVTSKLTELRLRTDDKATLVPFLNKEWILNGVMQIALHGDKDSTRLRAYETLGKTNGIDLFRETTRHEHITRTPEQVDSELRDRLSALRKAVTIEGAANQTPALDKPRRKRRT